MAEDQLGDGLVCCWGGPVGVSVAHSKLLTLSPEDSRSDGSDAWTIGAELLPSRDRIRQDTQTQKSSHVCNISSWKTDQSYTFQLRLGSTEISKY